MVYTYVEVATGSMEGDASDHNEYVSSSRVLTVATSGYGENSYGAQAMSLVGADDREYKYQYVCNTNTVSAEAIVPEPPYRPDSSRCGVSVGYDNSYRYRSGTAVETEV